MVLNVLLSQLRQLHHHQPFASDHCFHHFVLEVGLQEVYFLLHLFHHIVLNLHQSHRLFDPLLAIYHHLHHLQMLLLKKLKQHLDFLR